MVRRAIVGISGLQQQQALDYCGAHPVNRNLRFRSIWNSGEGTGESQQSGLLHDDAKHTSQWRDQIRLWEGIDG